MSARKAVDEELSQAKIIQVARELFATTGYNAVSMRAIAKSLGYSPGSLYYHFKAKAELLSKIVVTDFKRLDEVLEETVAAPPSSTFSLLERIFLAFIQFGMENRNAFEIMFLNQDSELNNYAQEAKMQSYDKFAEAVMTEICYTDQTREFRFQTVFVLFLALHGFVQYYIHSDQSYEDIAGLAKIHVKLLYKGLQ